MTTDKLCELGSLVRLRVYDTDGFVSTTRGALYSQEILSEIGIVVEVHDIMVPNLCTVLWPSGEMEEIYADDLLQIKHFTIPESDMKPFKKKKQSLTERKESFNRMLEAFNEIEFKWPVDTTKGKKNGNK